MERSICHQESSVVMLVQTCVQKNGIMLMKMEYQHQIALILFRQVKKPSILNNNYLCDLILIGTPINSSSGNMPTLNISHCSEDFYRYNESGPCLPICGSYETYSESNAKLQMDTQLVAASFVLFIGIIVLIASFIRRKIMYVHNNYFY